MDSVTTEEGVLTTPDGHALYRKTWIPSSAPAARLVFVHGFSDHCNAYGVFFPELAKAGVKVYSYDQRGWGRNVHSASDKGNTGPTSQIMLDLTSFIKSLPQEEKDIPLFLMGHSMGGGEVLYYAATGPTDVRSQIRGYMCESPFVALHPDARPWKSTVVLGRLAGKILPHRQLLQKMDASKMSRDEDVRKAWQADPLCHDTATLECLAAMLDRASDLEENKVVVQDGAGEGGKTRLWIGFGTGDTVLSETICRKWFEGVKVEDKEFRAYEGWYHKLHAEPGQDKFTFANDVSRWILDRCLDPSTKPRL